MKKLIRSTTGFVYSRVAKPLLFRQAPDDVHRWMLSLSAKVQKMPVLKELPGLWSYQNDRLKQRVMGVDFGNPVGLSAGFDKNIQLPPLLKSIGFGFMTGGSITALPCDGNARPWYHRLPKTRSLVVHAGLPNDGVHRITDRIMGYSAKTFDDFPLIASVAKTNNQASAQEEIGIEDYCASLKILEKNPRISIYEINISCPNAYGGEPFTEQGMLDRLLTRVDALNLSRSVVLKMPIDLAWDDFKALLDTVVSHKVQGVTIGNLLKDRSKADLKDELSDITKGSLSGVPTRDISNELIRKTYEAYGDKLVIVGVGGIFSAEDAYEKICAGASLVELITGMIFDGPQVVGQINEGLVRLADKDGFKAISDAVGSKTQKQVIQA